MSTKQQTPETDAIHEFLAYGMYAYTRDQYDRMAEHARTLELQRDAERLARQAAEKERDEARAEAKTHKQTIDAVIVASKWDGCDGLAKFIEQIRIEKDEAQQWIDSEPDWKDKYNAQMVAVLADRNTLRAEVARLTKEQDEEKEHHDFYRVEVERAKARAELATLRATREQDHGAAIEAAAKACAIEFASPECRKFARGMIRPILRALVATVTNSQQKGGEEPCAPSTNTSAPVTLPSPGIAIPDALSTGASNAAPTSDPEGAATPLPSVTKTAKEILASLQIEMHEPIEHRIESILSRFLGARERELRELRAECEEGKRINRVNYDAANASKHAKDFMEWSTQTEKTCHACEVEKLTGIAAEGNVHVCDPIAAGFTEHIDWPPRKKK